MINRIMNSRAAAVAFAASALIVAPAFADSGHKRVHAKNGSAVSVKVNLGSGVALKFANGNVALRNHHGSNSRLAYNNSRFNNGRNTRQLRRNAIEACRQAVKYESRDFGFRRVYLDDVERVRQIGPNGFLVRAEFEFEGPRRDFERDVTCEVRRGRVVDIDNLPRRIASRRGNNNQYGFSNNDFQRGGSRQNY